MKVVSAYTNRLGNRSNNQDRCLVVERPGGALLVVADGMGGHPRGDLAAQIAVDTLNRSFLSHRGHIDDPHGFLETAINHAHLSIVDSGRAQKPAIDPRTTCVVCLVQGDKAHWAHVGDSRLYLVRAGAVLTRTRDHTPVEDLLQSGTISEEDTGSHPLRNAVNRCLGGAPKLPKISFGEAELHPDDTLLLCSDGLWSALPQERLEQIPIYGDLEQSISRLTDEADLASYPHSDNISLVGLRWLSRDTDDATVKPVAKPPAADKPAAPKAAEAPPRDPVQQAIDDIHRAMLDYAAEMKK